MELFIGFILLISFSVAFIYAIINEVKIMKIRAKADLDYKTNLLQSLNEIKIELQYTNGRRAVRKEDVLK